MNYIVGLGNPGKEYEQTRHNVGFLALDYVIDSLSLPAAISSAQYSGRISEGSIGGEDVTLLLPETFMNNSGSAVKKLVPKSEIEKLVVVYDDVAIPFGEIKVSFGRGDGGHNGIKSIIASLGTKDFIRVRVGVAPASFWTGKTKVLTGDKMSRFVLAKFAKPELNKLNEEVFIKIQKAICQIVKEGHGAAMNTWNQ